MGKGRIIIIAGPTATGKTALGIALAKKLNGEIINADSRQVYKLMDIGTAKPTSEERKEVLHHLLDIVYPDQEFNAQKFREKALEALSEITSKGKNAIMVGGTGFYIKAFLEGLAEGAVPDASFRERFNKECEEHGLDYMYRRLIDLDPELSFFIHPNDRYRIMRALEIYEVTGIKPSLFKKLKKKEINGLYICIKLDRKVIYDNIDKRVDRMIKSGFVDEVKNLLEKGFDERLRPLRSHGYKEMIDFIKGRIDFDTAVERTKLRTRQYAKRQITWFRGLKDAKWFDPKEIDCIEKMCREFLEGKRNDKSAA